MAMTACTASGATLSCSRGPAFRERVAASRTSSSQGFHRRQRGAPLIVAAAGAATAGARPPPAAPTANYILSNGVVDYYELLGVDDVASSVEIKAAYRSLAKVCHVDIVGDNKGNREMCILLNEAYEVLMDSEQRQLYNADLDRALADEDDGYTGELLSRWMVGKKMGKNTNPAESRGVFVDEVTCIGCKQCVWCAPATFRMEDLHGRSRVFAQWLDTEDNIQAAMDACPVSCIHWVEKADLPALEFVVRNKVGRPNVASMMAAQGGSVPDVWDATAKFLKMRKQKEEERARAARYSAAQDSARRAAADAIMDRQAGWFDSFASRFGISNMAAAAASAMDEAVYGTSDDEYSAYQKVGRRRRSKQRVAGQYGAKNAGGGKVPRERALVLTAGVPLRPWQREQ